MDLKVKKTLHAAPSLRACYKLDDGFMFKKVYGLVLVDYTNERKPSINLENHIAPLVLAQGYFDIEYEGSNSNYLGVIDINDFKNEHGEVLWSKIEEEARTSLSVSCLSPVLKGKK